jgi:hypothetical protein
MNTSPMETDGFQRAPLAQFGLDNSSCWQLETTELHVEAARS